MTATWTATRRTKRFPAMPESAVDSGRPMYFVGGPWHGEPCHEYEDRPRMAVDSRLPEPLAELYKGTTGPNLRMHAALYYKCGVCEEFHGLTVTGWVFRWSGLSDDDTFRRLVVSMLIAGAMQ